MFLLVGLMQTINLRHPKPNFDFGEQNFDFGELLQMLNTVNTISNSNVDSFKLFVKEVWVTTKENEASSN